MNDVHLPDVLVFSPGTDLHDNKLYLGGELLLQEKVHMHVHVLHIVYTSANSVGFELKAAELELQCFLTVLNFPLGIWGGKSGLQCYMVIDFFHYTHMLQQLCHCVVKLSKS